MRRNKESFTINRIAIVGGIILAFGIFAGININISHKNAALDVVTDSNSYTTYLNGEEVHPFWEANILASDWVTVDSDKKEVHLKEFVEF